MGITKRQYNQQAVNVYWLTSNVYSIIQNLALAFVDKHRLPPKVKKPSY